MPRHRSRFVGPGRIFWILAIGNDLPHNITILHIPFLVGIPLILALSAAWWVGQLLQHRFSARLFIHDDHLEWQFGSDFDSEVDCLSDCSRFRYAGKHNYSARIEWNIEKPGKHAAGGWAEWAKQRGLPERLTAIERFTRATCG